MGSDLSRACHYAPNDRNPTRAARAIHGRPWKRCKAAQSPWKAQWHRTIQFSDGELRAGVGCYSVLPPSIHPSGHVYRWLIPLGEGAPPILDPVEAGFVPLNRENIEVPKTLVDVAGVDSWTDCQNLEQNAQPNSCLRYSLDSLLHAKVLLAIERTVKGRRKKRHEGIFDFVRELRAIPEFADARPQSFKAIVQVWHSRARPYTDTAFEENWGDFLEGWPKMKYPKGKGPIDVAFAKALQTTMPEVAQQFEQDKLRVLVRFCRELQRLNPAGPFFVTTREAGRLLEVSHVQVSRWLRLLCLDCPPILQLVSKGCVETGLASRYRYLAKLD
jgi:hypothetical protein